MLGHQRAPEDVLPTESPKEERAAAVAGAPGDADSHEATAAPATIDRKAATAQAKADPKAARERATAGQRTRAARARAERKAGKARRRHDRAEARAATEQARVDRLADKALASVARAKQRADRVTDRASAKAGARLARAAAKAQKEVDRASARAAASAEVAAARGRAAAALDADVLTLDADLSPARHDESLAHYIARIEAQRASRGRPSRRARTVKVVLVTLVVAACAVLPWAAPSVPERLADLVPGHGSTAPRVVDPPIDPPTTSVAPDVVAQQGTDLAGVRLEAAGAPREVSVPRHHVESRVVPISGQSGSLLPPSDPQQLGWWKEGQPVGAQSGSAVVTGHTVHTGGGALDHLDKLVVGDSVRVRTDAGWIRYVVQRTRIYSTAQLARDAKDVFALDGPGRVVLLTCDDWNGEFYESNAVVFATPVDDQPAAGQ
jgi:LPXTG-site transpeptidase (sortase) family protein